MRIFVGNPAPIEGAAIFIDEGLAGLTGADGSLTIAEITTGSHTIEARKEEYSPASATISVPETTSVTLTLTLITYKVVVVTILPGASIYVDGNYVGETKLGPTFVAMLTVEVPYGTHEFKATRSGYKDAVRIVDVTSDMTVEFILEALTYTITVSVQGSAPIAGAMVLFDHIVKGYTDSAGGITINNVTAGTHLIEARKSGYYDALTTIDVPETTSITLTMTSIPPPPPPTGRIYVHVTGSLHGIRIFLKDRPVYLDGALVGYTDPNGDLYITDVAEGTHSVRVVAPSGWNPPEDTKSVVVPDGSVSFYFWFWG